MTSPKSLAPTPDTDARAAALVWLGETQDAAALPALRQGLQAATEAERAAACRALGRLAAHASVEDAATLRGLIDTDTMAVGGSACLALGELAGQGRGELAPLWDRLDEASVSTAGLADPLLSAAALGLAAAADATPRGRGHAPGQARWAAQP